MLDQQMDGQLSRTATKAIPSTILQKGREAKGLVRECNIHSKPKLAEKVRLATL